tara:strand:- start:990 stop:2378 length:1389 start_codon:yes stop_codon:yes gene_type:complete
MKIGTDFSGIGSPEMALKMLGIEHEQVFACEIDKYARKSFEAVHGSPKHFYNDITTRDHSTVPQLDLYCAGFPCQSFSMAGKREGFEDVRGTLFFNVAEFIKINQPKVFVLENVKGLLSHDGGKTFQTIISLLTDNGGTANGQMFIPYFEDGLGYHIYYKVLNTKEHGIPQNRERIFIVGFREFREFSFPKPFPLELRLKDMLQDNPEYKYFLSDKMLDYFKVHNDRHEKKGTGFMWKPKDDDDIANALRANASLCATDNTIKVINKSIKQDVCTCIDGSYHKGFGIRNGVCRQVVKVPSATKKGFEEAEDGDSISLEHPSSKTRRGRVGKGVAQTVNTGNGQAVVQNNWKQLTEQRTEEAKKIRSENMKKGKDYSPRRGKELVERKDELANTVTSTQTKEQLLSDGFKIRRLTPLECWRLQGFPDDAFFRAEEVNSDTQLYRQAGNSITVNVMMEIFKKIY